MGQSVNLGAKSRQSLKQFEDGAKFRIFLAQSAKCVTILKIFYYIVVAYSVVER